MRFKIATWNINSVRLRAGLVTRFLADERPHVLFLQEIKSPTELVPGDVFAEVGYRTLIARGEPGYNGVLALARVPLEDGGHRDFCGRQDTRHQAVRLEGGVEIHNFYVPAGGDEPDPEANPKFAHKLQFLEEMREMFASRRRRPAILVGDLNVAPLEHDVWSHAQMRKVVSHTEPEITRLEAVMEAGGWVDIVRAKRPEPDKLYTWWSYRARDWEASDRGRRLDHIWATPDVAAGMRDAHVRKDVRGWERPSDHAPTIAEFDL